jgi:N-glycosylase/DNA lyase
MLNTLCAACGVPLGSVDGREFHSFPSLERLCELTEEELRGMGFGYR